MGQELHFQNQGQIFTIDTGMGGEKKKARFIYNEAQPFDQKLNLKCIFRNTFEPQGQMLQIKANYISWM